MDNRGVVIGVGGLGCAVLESMPDDPEVFDTFIAVDSEGAFGELGLHHKEHVVRELCVALPGNAGGMEAKPQVLSALRQAVEERFRRLPCLDAPAFVVVAAAQGGLVGSYGGIAVLEWLARERPGVPLAFNTSLPFEFQPEVCQVRAQWALTQALGYGCSIQASRLASHRRVLGSAAFTQDAFRIVQALWVGHTLDFARLYQPYWTLPTVSLGPLEESGDCPS
jgi:hypothetical protein